MSWSKVDFFESGDAYFEALEKAFREARQSILLEFYIFQMDRLGAEILRTLREARQRGVKVFLRLDGVGARENIHRIADFCEQADIELEVFHPLPFEAAGSYFPAGFAKTDSFLSRWMLINRRTHRKIVIVDEKIAFTGGMNIKEYQSERFSGAEAWHDLSLRLEGPGIREILLAFWFRPFKHFSFRSCLLNYSWRLRQARNNWISQAIKEARKRVWIITPYFAPTPAMLFQLRAAAKRGVEISLVLTRKTDVEVSRLAALGLYRNLLLKGIHICEYELAVEHRKLWVIDELALVGSTNLNHRSFLHDLELDVILREPENVREAERIFLKDRNASREVAEEYLKNLSWRERMLSWIAGWFSYWL